MKGFAVSKNRILKAKKIEAVLSNYFKQDIENFRMLDVGSGNGTICDYFYQKNEIFCVDVQDQRINRMPNFRKVESEKLPYGDESFDIVISNHVIEHVRNQELHLKEIYRVLKKEGVCYLATPNLIFPMEPHYKIPLIHYLPHNIFIKIIKLLNKYEEEIFLLSHDKLTDIVEKDFNYIEFTHLIIKNPEKYFINDKLFLINKLPVKILKKLNIISPTIIFILMKKPLLGQNK